ncbi:carbohydrate ABC transporter permease [Paenibacillus dokdonensis]|uniref:Carbohydrate ABC transporter permease n=1 Tax=Paenibacillus dokdonensis TaxID=2567944 RepID=A0ABU6GH05_9BACL|nr:carbohydrate ABC transporter permease [Paenibacillus dokdonensis]MEC0238493.1 carbohydrate ABC transporter permease [Paenibacillus dokdonensis]
MSIHTRKSGFDRVFDIANYTLMSLILLAIIYPLYIVVISSFSDPDSVNTGSVWLFPKGITFEGYHRIFMEGNIWNGYKNTLIYTFLGTLLSVVLTLPGAYALSRSDLMGRNFFMLMIVFTMFFGGGLIPTYLLVKNLGMTNTIWSQIVPGALTAYNMIITRTFFQSSIPKELQESAEIDGSSITRFFLKIVLPLSMPIVAVMVLFNAVAHWNAYFQGLIYLRDERLYPLQLVLREILIVNEAPAESTLGASDDGSMLRIAEIMKYGTIIVSSLPVLVLYPFLQRYFVKGVMIGSIKG